MSTNVVERRMLNELASDIAELKAFVGLPEVEDWQRQEEIILEISDMIRAETILKKVIRLNAEQAGRKA